MPNSADPSQTIPAQHPDYLGLVNFLIKPLLASPDSLRVDFEVVNPQRIWIRLAFEGEELGRVFGRGGRNLQAIRQVLATTGALTGQSITLDVYEPPSTRSPYGQSSGSDRRPPPRRSNLPPPRRSLPKFSNDES